MLNCHFVIFFLKGKEKKKKKEKIHYVCGKLSSFTNIFSFLKRKRFIYLLLDLSAISHEIYILEISPEPQESTKSEILILSKVQMDFPTTGHEVIK